jgi:hypothetical protein
MSGLLGETDPRSWTVAASRRFGRTVELAIVHEPSDPFTGSTVQEKRRLVSAVHKSHGIRR